MTAVSTFPVEICQQDVNEYNYEALHLYTKERTNFLQLTWSHLSENEDCTRLVVFNSPAILFLQSVFVWLLQLVHIVTHPLTLHPVPLSVFALIFFFTLSSLIQNWCLYNPFASFTWCDPNCFGQAQQCSMWWKSFCCEVNQKAEAEKKPLHPARH